MQKGCKRLIVFASGAIWILSFAGGCVAKLAYEYGNVPGWVNSVIVGVFVGLGLCFMSLTVITGNILLGWDRSSIYKRLRVIAYLVVFIPVFFIGLLSLWKALENLGNVILAK